MKKSNIILIVMLSVSIFLNLVQFSFHHYYKQQTRSNNKWTEHTHKVIKDIFIVQNELLKSSYDLKTENIENKLNEIKVVLNDNPQQVERLQTIIKLLSKDSLNIEKVEETFDSLLKIEEEVMEKRFLYFKMKY